MIAEIYHGIMAFFRHLFYAFLSLVLWRFCPLNYSPASSLFFLTPCHPPFPYSPLTFLFHPNPCSLKIQTFNQAYWHRLVVDDFFLPWLHMCLCACTHRVVGDGRWWTKPVSQHLCPSEPLKKLNLASWPQRDTGTKSCQPAFSVLGGMWRPVDIQFSTWTIIISSTFDLLIGISSLTRRSDQTLYKPRKVLMSLLPIGYSVARWQITFDHQNVDNHVCLSCLW